MSARETVAPAAVAASVLAWIAALGLELVHQGLSVAMSLINRGPAQASMSKLLAEQGQTPDPALLSAAYTFSVVAMGGLALVILAVVAWIVGLYRGGKKHSATARRVLTYFGMYFGIRAVLLLVASPTNTDIPTVLYAIDGCVQIAVATAALLGVTFGLKKESLKHTGEIAK